MTESEAVMAAVAAISTSAADDAGDVTEMLRRLVEAAADHMPVDGAGVMLADDSRLRFVHACSAGDDVGGLIGTVERLQERYQAGPCQDAFRSRREVLVPDLADRQLHRWDAYQAVAGELGLGSVAAVPLVGRGRCYGVLDLYRQETGQWDGQAMASMRLLAAVASAYLVMAVDRDAAREAERQLTHRNLHDHLTGLPNRTLLFDRLDHALHRAARHERTVAAFFIDLDHFKVVNDAYGHATGDAVLVEVGRRLASTLRADDTLARMSGDEFVLITEDLPQGSSVELDGRLAGVIARLHRALADPVAVRGNVLSVVASIGVAVSAADSTVDQLLAESDAAMYRAKREQPGVDRGFAGRAPRGLDRELAAALRDDAFRVHFQPIVSVRTNSVAAVEALLRWQHPKHGLLPAEQFIELAERTGAIVPVGHWLIEGVCAQVRRWDEQLPGQAPAVAYVNLDARQLSDPSLMHAVDTALERHRLGPDRLGFEVVEASFMDAHLLERVRQFQRRGHPIAVDDFGTGYSSLSRLVEVNADVAKIDKSFVAGIPGDVRRRAVIEAVVVVADRLGLDVVAEGVETIAQSRALNAIGCQLQQGFLHGSASDGEGLSRQWLGSTAFVGRRE